MNTQTFTIKIQGPFFGVPINDAYVAWIDEQEYKGNVISGATPGECLHELGHSLIVLEQYKKHNQK